MNTAVRDTSIDAFHSHHVSGKAAAQRSRIIEHIRKCGGDWSIGELAKSLKLEKSTVSARLNEALYETHELVERPRRRDRVSGVTVRPVGLPTKQFSLI